MEMAKEIDMQKTRERGDFLENLYFVDLNNRNDEFMYK